MLYTTPEWISNKYRYYYGYYGYKGFILLMSQKSYTWKAAFFYEGILII